MKSSAPGYTYGRQINLQYFGREAADSMEIQRSEIATEVARLCEERKITQYELAKRSGLQESSVRNMFQKGTTPTYRTLYTICRGLGITVPQFFTGSSFLAKLPPEEKELMDIYLKLDEGDRSRLLSYARRIIRQNETETTL